MDSWMDASTNGEAGNDNADDGGKGAPNFSAIKAVLNRDSTPSSENAAAKSTRIRRRNRLITSCLECRRRKLKCDKLAPCTNCTRFKRDCLYLAPSTDPSSQQKLADLKEKMGALEKNLEKEAASQKANKAHSYQYVDFNEYDEDEAGAEDDEILEPTPLAARENVYEDNEDDELVDLGVQMGKMRISERIGGWTRPKLVDELNDTLADVKSGGSRSRFQAQANEVHTTAPKLQASPKSYIGPGPDYIAPANGLFFGFPGTNIKTSLVDYLPTRTAADQLIAQYWTAVHYMCKVVHRQTFEAQYLLFWGQIETGSEPLSSVQAIMFAAMFSAAVSLSNEQTMQHFGTTKNALVDSLRSGTEMSLAKANFLRTAKLETMQAFVMYLIPLVRSEVSRAHSALVGTAIRLAECMGLHRDGSSYNMSPIDTAVRRMIWHQLSFLDMRTCDATGPRPQIRKDEYDTELPLNVDDIDLLSSDPPTRDRNEWTDATFLRIKSECVEMRRQTWFDVIQIDKKKKSVSSVLIKIQKFVASMQERWGDMMDLKIPFRGFARLMFDIATKALHLQVLHRYLFSPSQRMPDRLRQVLIEAGLGSMESSIAFETNPTMQKWTWYRGAINQYHSALLLMVEVYAYPMRKEAARIWKCLDYIFEIPPHLAPKQKAELVLTDLRDRMNIYHSMRRLKASNQMEALLSGTNLSRLREPMGNTGPSAATGQLQQSREAASAPSLSPPQPTISTESSRGSRPGRSSMDMSMGVIEDIDWAEWDEVFHPSINTGDINIPDFDMSDFTGGSTDFDIPAQPLVNIANFGNIGATTLDIPTVEDLADVQFTPTMFPSMGEVRQTVQGQPWRNFAYRSGNEQG